MNADAPGGVRTRGRCSYSASRRVHSAAAPSAGTGRREIRSCTRFPTRRGLRFHLEDQIDDVLERQIVSVRAMPAAPAQVITHSFLGNAGERVIDGIDAPPGELAVGLDRRFGL